MEIFWLILALIVMGVGVFFQAVISAAAQDFWRWVTRKKDRFPDVKFEPYRPSPPPPPPQRERYFITQHQFDRWTGELLKIYKARKAERYSFELQIEERVPAFKSEGWEHMLVNDMEIWWRNPNNLACAFLMRK